MESEKQNKFDFYKSLCYNYHKANAKYKGSGNILSKEIRRVLFEKDMQVTELAKLLNCSSENLYKKLKRDDWRESDVREIAEILNCNFIQKLEIR